MDNVIIAVPEEELIVSLYNNYLICHSSFNNRSQEETKMSVKAFSDYIMEYLKDRYNLEDEEDINE